MQVDKTSPSASSKLMKSKQNKMSSSLRFGFCCHTVPVLLISAVAGTPPTFHTSRYLERDAEENVSL